MGPGFESLREHNFYGPVAQLAEATDSKPVQCEFESHPDYFIRNGYSSVEVVGLGLSNLYGKKTTFEDIHSNRSSSPTQRVNDRVGRIVW